MNKRFILPGITMMLTGLLIPVVEATAVTSPSRLNLQYSEVTIARQEEVQVLVAGAARQAAQQSTAVAPFIGKAASGIIKTY